VIFGTKGDKLRLPDGREFDCIVAAGGPPDGRRWQCARIDPNDADAGDPFALEAGPLTPIDASDVWPGSPAPGFEAFVAGELGALDGSEHQLDGAAQSAVEFDGAGAFDDSFRRLVDPATEAHVNIRRALDEDDPIDELGAAGDLGDAPDREGQQYVEEEPADLPTEDPGGPPGQDGRDHPPRPGSE
jgi:hypothetical protein